MKRRKWLAFIIIAVVGLVIIGVYMVNRTNGNEQMSSELNRACKKGDYQAAERLIGSGADVNNHSGDDGTTPLLYAVDNHHLSIVKLLLTSGADPNYQNDLKIAPITRAAWYGNEEIFDELVKHGALLSDINDLLLTASWGGNSKIVKYLLDKGATVNGVDRNKSTPLHNASSGEVAKLLVDRGASIELQNDRGRTPLHEAAYWNRVEVVEVLLQAGANPHTTDNNGMTPVQLAIQRKSDLAINILKGK